MISFNLTLGYPAEGSLLTDDQRLDVLHKAWAKIAENREQIYSEKIQLYGNPNFETLLETDLYLETQPFVGDDSINFHCSGGGDQRLFKEQLAHTCCLLILRECAKQGVYISLEIV